MSFSDIFLLAIGLVSDSFAIAMTTATADSSLSSGMMLRISLLFGLTQFLALVIGWQVGIPFRRFFSGYEHWATCFVLVGVGVKMMRQLFQKKTPNSSTSLPMNITRWVILAIITNLDDAAVGVGLGLLFGPMPGVFVSIGGLTTATMFSGFLIGRKLHQVQWKWASLPGAAALLLLGLRIATYHIP